VTDADYWRRRHASTPGLRAVGNFGSSEDDLVAEYGAKHETLCRMLRVLSPDSALEVGYGQGLGALACAATGVDWYRGVDIAAPPPPGPWPPGFRFESGPGEDIEPEECDLALCLDVAYHVTDDGAFARLLRVLASAAEVWLTDREHARKVTPPHMRLRGLGAYTAALGDPVEVVKWSDLSLWRFRPGGDG